MNVYGSMPPRVDDFSVRIPEEEGRDEDKKMGKKEAAENRRGFLARLFGKKHS